MKYLVLWVGLCLGIVSQAQTTDEEFADFYFQNQEYEKAILYLEKLYDADELKYFTNYFECLLLTEQDKDAEKLAKKHIKKHPGYLKSYTLLMSLYSGLGEDKKADKTFEDLLENLPMNRVEIIEIAKSMIALGDLDKAEAIYKKGSEILNGATSFFSELANLNGERGDLPGMVSAYVQMVAGNPRYYNSVQIAFSRYLSIAEEPAHEEMVRGELLKAIQEDPNKTVLSELLIWVFYQTKNFNAAFTQVKALDTRLQEDGNRMLDFANTCMRNQAYSAAQKAYQYLLENKDDFVKEQAMIGNVRAHYSQLKDKIDYPEEEVAELNTLFESTINALGRNVNAATLMQDFASFKLKYRNDLNGAIDLLYETLDLPNIYEKISANSKLLLGDLLIIEGNIWEASLLYSQVDKAFKEDVLGAEAKYRNARISYFAGDFKWAQDQLDILKASTSKLIANDALKLSLTITDNLGLDSLEQPMMWFALAELYTFQNKLDSSLLTLDQILAEYPTTPLADDIVMEKAQIAMKQKRFEDAAKLYGEVIEVYGTDILADEALFKLATLQENILNKPEQAKENYRKLMLDFPGSLFTVDARARFRALRGDFNEEKLP